MVKKGQRKAATKKPTKRPAQQKQKSKQKKSTSGNIQTKVRDLMLNAISERNLSLDQLSALAQEILEASGKALKNALPASRKSVLRQVLHGIDEALAATAKAGVSSVQHAQRYGLRFAQRDLASLGKRLGELEQDLVGTVDHFARRIGGEFGRELASLQEELEKAGTRVRPAATSASKAIMEHGDTLVREVASVGANVGGQLLRGVLRASGGLFEGVVDAVSGTSKKRRPKSR